MFIYNLELSNTGPLSVVLGMSQEIQWYGEYVPDFRPYGPLLFVFFVEIFDIFYTYEFLILILEY